MQNNQDCIMICLQFGLRQIPRDILHPNPYFSFSGAHLIRNRLAAIKEYESRVSNCVFFEYLSWTHGGPTLNAWSLQKHVDWQGKIFYRVSFSEVPMDQTSSPPTSNIRRAERRLQNSKLLLNVVLWVKKAGNSHQRVSSGLGIYLKYPPLDHDISYRIIFSKRLEAVVWPVKYC